MDAKYKDLAKRKLPLFVPLGKLVVKQSRLAASRRLVKRILKEKKSVSIEVGAGNKAGRNGWITIDMTEKCDLFWDLRNGLPFPDGSIGKIYSSHFFEHLSFKETRQFLAECKRALAPGGSFSICVPDARTYLKAYVEDLELDADFLDHAPANNRTTKIDYVNYIAYMDGEHKYMFDRENLLFILEAQGFKNVHLRPFDPDLDLMERDFGSIYAEAEK